MFRRYAQLCRAEQGFTLFEALVAVALMGLILGTLASVTSQWLPSWNRGIVRAQRNEQVAIALDRLAADLSAADYVARGRDSVPLFSGTEQGIIFVRSVLGPNGNPGLEIVRIAETNSDRGPVLVRTRAPFVLLPDGDPHADLVRFVDPVVLLRAPFRIAFAYADVDGKWINQWRGSGELPAAVRFDVRDVERGTVLSSATRIHVEMRAPRPDPSSQPEAAGVQAGNGPTQ
ncbi:type II secretion system protein J [Bradyrhizobium sp. CCGB20]|uniref:PulJ/GspJ family protein n=1 Tax=Bradyrhizobium sp. CCGB20 TaxID=2949633 RepID=UPI0020B42A62|nr:prepilin-type N-terminal cleavage/methylation domain-containing protein [Bradyrhizobium sp. CCGB20]MCP3401794.1 prepilin-type N-terminal cleavage/methylation domain-containing protein [Bradyrhizobium sp. CCGB20]